MLLLNVIDGSAKASLNKKKCVNNNVKKNYYMKKKYFLPKSTIFSISKTGVLFLLLYFLNICIYNHFTSPHKILIIYIHISFCTFHVYHTFTTHHYY